MGTRNKKTDKNHNTPKTHNPPQTLWEKCIEPLTEQERVEAKALIARLQPHFDWIDRWGRGELTPQEISDKEDTQARYKAFRSSIIGK